MVTLNTNVQIPDGAEVTEFSCHWYDNDDDGDPTNDAGGDIVLLDANLFRRELSAPAPVSMARIVRHSATTGGIDAIPSGVVDAPDIVEPSIDNTAFSYYINAVFSLGETTPLVPSAIPWYGCQVRYELP
jgi:hypothetical protein